MANTAMNPQGLSIVPLPEARAGGAGALNKQITTFTQL